MSFPGQGGRGGRRRVGRRARHGRTVHPWVAFLASGEAGFMTGALHLVDGGAATMRYPDVLGRVTGARASS
ncbi:MAG TPA: hypothetical protein VK549_17545 [Acidimicrobiia bacterium]|nr:hypothetical protein [Acidimicrobiia bacterium]